MPSLDRSVFSLAVLAVLGICLPLGLMPERGGAIVISVAIDGGRRVGDRLRPLPLGPDRLVPLRAAHGRDRVSLFPEEAAFLRASTWCHALLGPKGEKGLLARSIDLLFMVALLGGAATFLGFTAPMIAAAIAFIVYIVAVGPTSSILRMGTDSLGFMFDRLARMLTWTDPVERSGFVEDWTIFDWAWWIAYGPFVGLLVTRP